MAEIIKHNEPSDLADMPDHPIPALNGLDVMAVKEKDGADLSIVIATPINGDEVSQKRFITKLQNYLGFINSEEFLVQTGSKPTVENTKITVHIHPKSDGEFVELINNCKEWANENNSTLELELLKDEHG